MSNNLYLEAIEAAEEIKHAAEENVKQRLIESMTPQIKLLVEKRYLKKKKKFSKIIKKMIKKLKKTVKLNLLMRIK